MTLKKGGKFLGEGAYGCVYSPPVSCNDKNSNNFVKKNYPNSVGKVIHDIDNANDEIKLSEIFTKIDPSGLHLVPLVGHCNIDKKQLLKADKNPEKCRIVKKKTKLPKMVKKFNPFAKKSKVELIPQLIYKYKGVALDTVLDEKSHILPLSYYLTGLLNIARGIELLQKHKYAHMDIKLDNILIANIDNGKEQMLLIDLGISDKLENVYKYNKSFHKLTHTSTHYPPEFQVYIFFRELIEKEMLQKLLKVIKTDIKNENIKEDKIRESIIQKIVLHAPYNLYKVIYEQNRFISRNNFWNRRYNTEFSFGMQEFIEEILFNFVVHYNQLKTKTEYLHHLENLFYTKFSKLMDVFQMGGVILNILEKYPTKTSSLYKKLNYLARRMYNFNPINRLSIKEVIQEITQISNTENPLQTIRIKKLN